MQSGTSRASKNQSCKGIGAELREYPQLSVNITADGAVEHNFCVFRLRRTDRSGNSRKHHNGI